MKKPWGTPKQKEAHARNWGLYLLISFQHQLRHYKLLTTKEFPSLNKELENAILELKLRKEVI